MTRAVNAGLRRNKMFCCFIYIFMVYFLNFCLLFDRTVVRQEIKLEREMGTGSGKIIEPGLEYGMPEAQLRYMSTRYPWAYRCRWDQMLNFIWLTCCQTASVRTRSFVYFILLQISLQTSHNSTFKTETKRQCCADYIGSDVTRKMWFTVFITWALLCCLLLQIVWYVLSICEF